MSMETKLSKRSIRNKARRLAKRLPLFALMEMREILEDEEYTWEAFIQEIEYKKPPKRKKGKPQLPRYGRYSEMNRLLMEYQFTGDIEMLYKAQKLRNRIAKPYQLRVNLDGEWFDYTMPATTSYSKVEYLLNQSKSMTKEAFDELVDKVYSDAFIKS